MSKKNKEPKYDFNCHTIYFRDDFGYPSIIFLNDELIKKIDLIDQSMKKHSSEFAFLDHESLVYSVPISMTYPENLHCYMKVTYLKDRHFISVDNSGCEGETPVICFSNVDEIKKINIVNDFKYDSLMFKKEWKKLCKILPQDHLAIINQIMKEDRNV